jgi:hypothetical protein
MAITLRPDLPRARKIAQTLCDRFYNSKQGVHGETVETSWEKVRPGGLKTGSRDQLLYIALTSSVDRQRDAIELWAGRAKPTFESASDRWLFDPDKVVHEGIDRVSEELKRLGISQKHANDANAWYSICEALSTKWGSDPRNFLNACKCHAPTIYSYLRNDKHRSSLGGRDVQDYPQLRGPKIGPMFLRFLRDWAHIQLTGMDEMPVPVDSQVLRATLCSGVLRGRYTGPQEPLFAAVRAIWREAVKGLTNSATGGPMIGLDVDGPLWRVGRYWCSPGNKRDCPCAPGCAPGITIEYSNGLYRINAGT